MYVLHACPIVHYGLACVHMCSFMWQAITCASHGGGGYCTTVTLDCTESKK